MYAGVVAWWGYVTYLEFYCMFLLFLASSLAPVKNFLVGFFWDCVFAFQHYSASTVDRGKEWAGSKV